MTQPENNIYVTLDYLKGSCSTNTKTVQQYFNHLAIQLNRNPAALVDPLRLPSLRLSHSKRYGLEGGSETKTKLISMQISDSWGSESDQNQQEEVSTNMLGITYKEAIKIIQKTLSELYSSGETVTSVQVSTTSNAIYSNFMHVVLTHRPNTKHFAKPTLTVYSFRNWKALKENLKTNMRLLQKQNQHIISVSVDHQTRASKKQSIAKMVGMAVVFRYAAPVATEVYDFLTPRERLMVFVLHADRQKKKSSTPKK